MKAEIVGSTAINHNSNVKSVKITFCENRKINFKKKRKTFDQLFRLVTCLVKEFTLLIWFPKAQITARQRRMIT